MSGNINYVKNKETIKNIANFCDDATYQNNRLVATWDFCLINLFIFFCQRY